MSEQTFTQEQQAEIAKSLEEAAKLHEQIQKAAQEHLDKLGDTGA